MSFLVTEAFVTQFQDTFHVQAQQMISRLERFTRRYPGTVVGESFTVDVLSPTTADVNRPRDADLQYANMIQQRRFADMVDAEKAEFISSMDKLKLLIEPTNQYSTNLVNAINRQKDITIINNMLGAVRTRSSTVALPAAQIIAAGGTGLTVAKLRQAKVLLDEAEMDDSDFFEQSGIHMGAPQDKPFGNVSAPAYVIAVSTKMLDGLLADTTVTSQDYNVVKALVNGAINTFMGFFFVRLPTGSLPYVTGSTTRTCVAFAPRAVEYGVGKDVSAQIERVPTKNGWQVLASSSFGACRAEDAGVVSIACIET